MSWLMLDFERSQQGFTAILAAGITSCQYAICVLSHDLRNEICRAPTAPPTTNKSDAASWVSFQATTIMKSLRASTDFFSRQLCFLLMFRCFHLFRPTEFTLPQPSRPRTSQSGSPLQDGATAKTLGRSCDHHGKLSHHEYAHCSHCYHRRRVLRSQKARERRTQELSHV